MTFILWIRVTLVIKVFRLIVCDSEKFGRSWVRRFEVHIQRIRTYCRCIWLNLFTVSIAWGTLGVKNLKLKIDKNTLQHSYSISHNFLFTGEKQDGGQIIDLWSRKATKWPVRKFLRCHGSLIWASEELFKMYHRSKENLRRLKNPYNKKNFQRDNFK